MNVHERAEMLAAVALDFPLGGDERRELDVHLRSCLACRSTADRLDADAAGLRGIGSVEPAPQLRVAFAAAVRRPDRVGSIVLTDLRPWLRLAAVAALAAALIGGLLGVGALVGSHPSLPGPESEVTPKPGPSGPATVVGGIGADEQVCSQPTGLRAANGAVYVVCVGELERAALGGEPAVQLHSGIADVAPFGPDVWVVGTDVLERLDAMSLAVRARSTSVGGDIIAVDDGAVWLLQISAGRLIRVDPRSLAVVATIGIAHNPAGLLLAFGRVWVSGRDDGTVQEVDPATNRVVQTFHVGEGPAGLAATASAVWVANNADGTASRIDPTTGRSLTMPIAPAVQTSDLPSIAGAGTSVWVVDSHQEAIAEVDDATATIRRWIAPPVAISTDDDIVAMDVSGRSVWIVDLGSLLQEIVLP